MKSVPIPRNLSDKEMIATFNTVALTPEGLRNIITARLYKGRSSSASVIHAVVWINYKDVFISTYGKAGGRRV